MAGGGEIEGAAGGGRVALKQGRDKRGRGLTAAGQNVGGDGVAVDGKREGAADAGIGERGFADVKPEKIGLENGIDAQSGGLLALEREDFGKWERPSGVELAGAVGPLFGVDAIGGKEADAIKADAGAIPVNG